MLRKREAPKEKVASNDRASIEAANGNRPLLFRRLRAVSEPAANATGNVRGPMARRRDSGGEPGRSESTGPGSCSPGRALQQSMLRGYA